MKKDEPKINIFTHNLSPQIEAPFNYNIDNGYSYLNNQFNSNFNNVLYSNLNNPNSDNILPNQFANFSQPFLSSNNAQPNSFANFPQTFQNVPTPNPCQNSQIEQSECKSSNGIFKNIFKKTKSLPLVQDTVQPLNNIFNGHSPYSYFNPYQLNSFGQSMYPGNVFNNLSQPFLNNSATFYPQQNFLASPSYPDENMYRMQNPATPLANEGIFSTPLEMSKQKFCHNSFPSLEVEVPCQTEAINQIIEDDRIPRECAQTNADVHVHVDENVRHVEPIKYDYNNNTNSNGPLANTINYLSQACKTTTLDRALKLDNKMNDKKYNRFASIHNGPRVVNKKSLTIWEIDQLINENYNNRFWKDELDELVFKKFSFVEN